jgi:hypothetical protein
MDSGCKAHAGGEASCPIACIGALQIEGIVRLDSSLFRCT